MPRAQVQILHAILTPNGWLMPGPAEMDADEARSHPPGYVEILSIDGQEQVKPACCSND